MRVQVTETPLYTAQELKDKFPGGFDKAVERHAENFDWPWRAEEFGSLKATVEAFGANLDGWNLSMESHRSDITVSVDDFQDDEDGYTDEDKPKGAEWALREVLAPLGYVKDGKADFPGHCRLTGYCADDDFMEAVYKNLESGDTLTEALQALARVYANRAAEEFEYQTAPGQFIDLAEANEWEFDESGRLH